MNMTSNRSSLPRVLIDTTILCAALRVDGHARKLLRLARVFYIPVVTNVVLFEFWRNATEGLGNVKYLPKEIEDFLHAFIFPLLNESTVKGL